MRYLGMDQYLLIPFLMGWTSICQLFWCSPGVQGFDTLPLGQSIVCPLYPQAFSWNNKSVGFTHVFFSPTCGKWWTWPKKGLDSGVPYFRQPATWENWWKLWVSASLDTLVSCKAFEAWYPTFPLRSGAGSPPRWLKHRHDVSVLSSVHQNLAEP